MKYKNYFNLFKYYLIFFCFIFCGCFANDKLKKQNIVIHDSFLKFIINTIINIDGAYYRDNTLYDKYGNEYYDSARGPEIRGYIKHSPDLEVLRMFQNYIYNVDIYTGEDYSATIKDISFLSELKYLKKLNIYGNETIETFEPLKYLTSLEYLSIDEDIKGTIDCSILNELKTIKTLYISSDDLINKEILFNLPHLEELALNDYYRRYKKREYCDYFHGFQAYEYQEGKYNILQNNVSIFYEPSIYGNTLGLLSLHDEVEILENSLIAEKINNIWGYWYKIKHKNTIGYIFGGNIAANTFAIDFDKNGIKDYFYYRFSSTGGGGKINPNTVIPNTDIMIYINNKKIELSVPTKEDYYNWVKFEEYENSILMGLSQEGRHGFEYMQIFKVTPDGKIEYLNDWNERDGW